MCLYFHFLCILIEYFGLFVDVNLYILFWLINKTDPVIYFLLVQYGIRAILTLLNFFIFLFLFFWCASLCSSMVEDEFLNPTSSFTSSFHQSAINNYIDPFYLHHIDNTSLVLVSDLLTETNYVSWSKSMIIALTVKNKICFVDGKIIKSASDSS